MTDLDLAFHLPSGSLQATSYERDAHRVGSVSLPILAREDRGFAPEDERCAHRPA